ncbi:MAG: SMC family ATPase, partial [Nocardioides sp.]
MRLHRLRVTAFGPFAETVEVDFDRLSDAGIFLLSGPTGAGKTALLDAVAFALYAEVPGDRNVAKRLRCDSAPELLAPEVTLEVTLRNRQLRITRSPAWQRPKRRGTGQTTQQAKVVLQERLAGGGWVTRSTRIDEAALLLGDLLGLTHAQFCQVVMLPQGRFQAFLRAGGEDRQRLLQRLFHTGRFEAVEKWLAEQRRSTRRAAQEAHSTMLSTAHALARECPAADPMPLAEAEVLVWAEGVADRLKVEAAQSQSRLERWRIVNDGRERAHRGALELDQRQARHRQALEALDALLAASTLQEARAEQLRRAERADPLIVLVDQQRVAAAEVADARTQVRASAARDHTAQSLPDASATHQLVDVVQGLDELERALATFRALSPLADQVEALSSELAAAAGDAARSHDAWLQAQTRVSVCAGHQEALTGELMAAQTATERLREVSEEHSELVAWHADFTTLGRLRHQHGEVQQELLRCREISVSCKETWLNLQQVRISGMAAELAGALAAGCRCPVCGSAEHPHPARPSSFAPDAVDERAARKSYEDAESLAQAARDQQVGLSTRISALADQLGTRDEAEV